MKKVKCGYCSSIDVTLVGHCICDTVIKSNKYGEGCKVSKDKESCIYFGRFKCFSCRKEFFMKLKLSFKVEDIEYWKGE